MGWRRDIWRTIGLNLLLAVAYVASARLGLLFAYVDGMATLIWMPTGISLAAVLLGGNRMLAGVALGAFVTVSLSRVPLWVAATTTGGNVLEAYLGALFLRRFACFDVSLRRIRDVLNLTVWAGMLSTIPSTVVGVLSLYSAGKIGAGQMPVAMLVWYLGNFVSDILVAPLILVWSRPALWRRQRLLEFMAALVFALAVTASVFGAWFSRQPYPLAFLLLPLLMLIAIRYGQHGTVLANFTCSALAVWLTVSGRGPYAAFGLHESVILLWAFVLAAGLSTLLLAASASELLHAQRERERAYAQLRQILDNAPNVAIQGYDAAGKVVFWNLASERMYGFREPDVLGKRLGEFLLSPEDAEQFERSVQQIVHTRQPLPLREWETRSAEGTPVYILSALFPVFVGEQQVQVVCMDVDITERKRLEAEVMRAQRLDSIGRLAGGIAHDFNNLLTAMMSYADIALSRLPAGHPAVEDLQRLLDAANRAGEMVRHLLAFARRQTFSPQIIQLNDLLHGMAPILIRLLGKHVDLQIVTEPALRTVRADLTQIEQVVLNLAVNARDAMPEGGTLTIRTSNVKLGDEAPLPHPDLSPGEYVLLTVSDTGTGIEPETIEHIFEPFYTTKGEQGTGLGLAVVYGVVMQSGGHIDVESTIGQGTSFRIYLPPAD